MKLKPKDLGRLKRLRHDSERNPHVDDGLADDEIQALKSTAVPSEKPGLVELSASPGLAARMRERVKNDQVRLSYGILVIYSCTGTYHNMSMSRDGKPDIPRAVQLQILEALGFNLDVEVGKMGRALHALEPFSLPMDA